MSHESQAVNSPEAAKMLICLTTVSQHPVLCQTHRKCSVLFGKHDIVDTLVEPKRAWSWAVWEDFVKELRLGIEGCIGVY